MRKRSVNVLLIEDNSADARLIEEMLKESYTVNFTVSCSKRLADGVQHLKDHRIDVVLLDLMLPDSSGISTFEKIYSLASHLPIIVMTGAGDEQMAIESLRGGSQDFLFKNKVDSEQLIRSILYAIERKRLENTLDERCRAIYHQAPKSSHELAQGNIKVLLIEDNPADARLIEEMLKESSGIVFKVTWFKRLAEGIQYLKTETADVVLLDLTLPDSMGLGTFEKIYNYASQLPIIILTGGGNEDMAIESVRGGAQDYLYKNNVDSELLIRSIRYAIERKHLEDALRMAQTLLEDRVKQRTRELSEANEALRREIDERIKVESELKKSKAQAELYLDLMRHDISNINQVILGYLDMAVLSSRIGEDNKDLLDGPIAMIESSTRLIDNVRKLQLAVSGDIPVVRVDLGSVLAEVVRSYSAIPGRKVDIHYKSVTDRYVLASELLRDVFANLIDNSIKHSDPGKPLMINVLVADIREDGQPYYRVIVEDNGPGIPDILKKQLLVDLTNLQDKTIRRKLGLQFVKILIDIYKGRVEIEDRIRGDSSQGTSVIVLLPAVEK